MSALTTNRQVWVGGAMSGLMVDWLHVNSDNKQASVCVCVCVCVCDEWFNGGLVACQL